MKWIFAWNDAALEQYGDMIRVAVASARQNTTLEMHCLHDGLASTFTRWLQFKGVEIHPARFRFAAQFEEIARKRQNPWIARIANGTYLRLEIPSLSQAWNWNDEFVFYTDIDALFLRDPVPMLEQLKPRFFAVAPELWRDNFLHMNAGVMLLNLPALRRVETRFLRFVERHLETSIASSWDQGVLRAYFDPLHRAAWRSRVPDKMFYKPSRCSRFRRTRGTNCRWNLIGNRIGV